MSTETPELKETLRNCASGRQLLAENTIMLVGTGFGQVATMGATLLLARRGGPTGFATLTIALAVSALIVDVGDFGTSNYLARLIASGRLRLARARHILHRRIFVFAGTLVAMAPTATLVPQYAGLLLLALIYSLARLFSGSYTALLRATFSFRRVALAMLLERVTLLSVCIMLTYTPFTVSTVYLIAAIIGSAAATIYTARHLPRARRGNRSFAIDVRQLYVHSRHLGMSGLASDLSMFEAPLVTLIAGVPAGGRFAGASRMSGPLGLPASTIANSLFTRLASVSAGEAVRLSLKAQLWLAIVIAPPLALIAVFPSEVVNVALGDQYGATTAHCLMLIVAAVALGSINQLLAVTMQAQDLHRPVSIAVTTSMLSGLAAICGGAIVGGAVGAGVGILVKELVAFAGLAAIFATWWARTARRPLSAPTNIGNGL